MTINKINDYDIVHAVADCITHKKNNHLIYAVAEHPLVFSGYGNNIDPQLCAQHNAILVPVNNQGGVIVSDIGSISMAQFSYNSTHFNHHLAAYLFNKLHNKGLNVSFNNNDILIDGMYKVASFSSREFNGIVFSAFQISYTVDLNLIHILCPKEMKKVPRGLADYGITHDEMLEWFFDFCNQYEPEE